MKKLNLDVRTICEVGIIAAIGYVLDGLQGIIGKGLFINGGSIGFAMVAVLIIAFRRGWLPAVLTGLIMGGLDLAVGAYILHPAQLLLDYILPYAVVGFAGFFKPLFDKSETKGKHILWLAVGSIVGGLLKLLSHYLAGVIFWADPSAFAWGLNNMNVFLYCFLYNFAFIGPSIVLSGGLLIALYARAPRLLLDNNVYVQDVSEQKRDLYPIISSITFVVGGTVVFGIFLYRYIISFEGYSGDGYMGYDFDPDCMLVFFQGLILALLGAISLIMIKKNKYSYTISNGVLCIIIFNCILYAIARLIRSYIKGKDPTLYWIWIGICLASLLVAVFILLYYRLKLKKK